MLDQLLSLDSRLLVFLNGLGSATFDGLWLIITKQQYWTPLFLILLYFIYKKIGTKQFWYVVLFITLILVFTDQITNVFKNGFQRLRPCNSPDINTIIRVVKTSGSYSFFSGHAANSMAVATFIYLLMKSHFKYFYLLFLWPLVFAYSRIYLGLHYPIDILCGYLFGFLSGYSFYKLHQYCQKKYFPQ
jgi:undecaprenyl-diphosphatase